MELEPGKNIKNGIFNGFNLIRFMNIYIYVQAIRNLGIGILLSPHVVTCRFSRSVSSSPKRWSFQNQEIEGDFLLNPADDCLSTTTVAKGALLMPNCRPGKGSKTQSVHAVPRCQDTQRLCKTETDLGSQEMAGEHRGAKQVQGSTAMHCMGVAPQITTIVHQMELGEK